MLSVTFLGTSAARPTVERNVSGVALVREGETLLFECGEGTQRQMMRYGVSFALSEIFFTHFHADHFLGVIGLIRTLGLQARAEPIMLYGPHGAKKVLTQAIQLGVERIPFQVEIREVKPGDTVEGPGKGKGEEYNIHVFKTEHGGGSVGYALREHERRGRFDVEKAQRIPHRSAAVFSLEDVNVVLFPLPLSRAFYRVARLNLADFDLKRDSLHAELDRLGEHLLRAMGTV